VTFFSDRADGAGIYEQAADGAALLGAEIAGAGAGTRIHVVTNWFEELKTRMPTQ
jgi:hypothetical protein